MQRDLLGLLGQSPLFHSRPEPKRKLVADVAGLLAQSPEGLSSAELRSQLIRVHRHDPEMLHKEQDRTIEACGGFRFDVKGKYRLFPLELLERPLADWPVVVMDLEATGGRPPLHRLVEVALIRREPDGSETQFESLANPGRPLPWFVRKMTGLTSAQIDGAPSMDEVFDQLEPLLEGALLVFHGSTVDLELINYEVHRRHGRLLPNPVLCTIALTRLMLPELTTMGLDKVSESLGIVMENQHRALDDALATLQIHDIFASRFSEEGIEFLVDLAFFQGNLPVAPFLKSNLSVEGLSKLPSGPAAYVLRDEENRPVASRTTENLRETLWTMFLGDQQLTPEDRASVRQARILEFREAGNPTEAQGLMEEMLAAGPRPSVRGRTKGPWRRGR